MSTDPSKVCQALQSAISVNVHCDDDGNFIIDCSHEHLQASLGSRVVQQALNCSGYNAVPAENCFSVSHQNKDVGGKLYAKDKAPKKEEEKKD
uniref:Uncharacterized protein n=1 Tax=Panagrolaimus davidi TaxID=227884 RepID=A0A914PL26_9BILA